MPGGSAKKFTPLAVGTNGLISNFADNKVRRFHVLLPVHVPPFCFSSLHRETVVCTCPPPLRAAPIAAPHQQTRNYNIMALARHLNGLGAAGRNALPFNLAGAVVCTLQ